MARCWHGGSRPADLDAGVRDGILTEADAGAIAWFRDFLGLPRAEQARIAPLVDDGPLPDLPARPFSGCTHAEARAGDCVDHEHCAMGGTCSNVMPTPTSQRPEVP